jgi:ABC-type multidrug transport system fused ATPase/permease subunit
MKNFLTIILELLDKEDRKKFIGFVFLLIFSGGISLLSIAVVIPLLNFILNPEKIRHIPFIGNLSYLNSALSIALIVIVIFWLKTFAGIFVLKKQSRFLFDLSGKIRGKLFRYYLQSPYSYHTEKNSNTFISLIISDVNIVTQNIFNSLGIALNESIVSFIVFIGLLFIAPVFTISVIGFILIASKIYMSIFKSRALNTGKERSDSYCEITKCVSQGLGSIRETKLYQKENTFSNQVDHYSNRISAAGCLETVFSQSFKFFIEAVSITVILFIIFIYLLLGYPGKEIVTLVSVFGIASIQLLPSLNRLIQAIGAIRCSFSSINKVHQELKNVQAFEINDLEKEASLELAFKSFLTLKNICFFYGKKKILNNISITIEKGKRIAFVGESGAGKTTIIDIILGLLTPFSGEILIDDTELSSQNIRSWQSQLGYIPQTIYLYDNDIRQNIAFGVSENDIDNNKVLKCLELAALTDFVQSLPNGIFTRVGENGVQLSGGQRQRIGIARALYRNPSMLIMDEATAALDNKTEAEVTQALAYASNGRTIITIAHRISTIANYDVIYYLHKGEIVASGTYQQLLQHSDEFKRLAKASMQENAL